MFANEQEGGDLLQKQGLALKWLLLGALITNTGISTIWPLTTIYLHEYLHKSLTVAGVVLFINSAIMIAGNYLGGYLFDKWRPYRTLLTGISINVISAIILVFFHGWPSYAIFLISLSFGNGIVGTCITAFATMVENQQPSYVFNILYFMNNIGIVMGTLIVGFVLPFGIQYIFMLSTLLFILFLVVAALNFNVTPSRKRAKHQKGAQRLPKQNLSQIWGVLLVFIIAWVIYAQWQSTISTFMVHHGMTVKDYSFVWTFNAIVVVTFQPILTHFDSFLYRHIKARLNVGFLLFGSAFVILIFAQEYWHFLLAMGILTLGEISAFPSVSTFVDGLVYQSQRGQYQGIVNAAASFGRAVGPLVGAQIIALSSYHTLFITCVIILLIFLMNFNVITGRTQAQDLNGGKI